VDEHAAMIGAAFMKFGLAPTTVMILAVLVVSM
jgi:hypothetical protein